MSKILFIVPPLTGHINPTVSLGQYLIQQGHEVAWVGYTESLSRSLPAQHRVCSLDQTEVNKSDKPASGIGQHGNQERRGFTALFHLWESIFIPLARQSFPHILAHLSSEKPDLCIVDQQMLGGAMACQKLGIPYLTSATTSAALIQVLKGLPQVNTWHDNLLKGLWREHDLNPYLGLEQLEQLHLEQPRLDLSPLGTLAFSSKELTLSIAPEQHLPSNIHFVGPALEGERTHIDFPWSRLNREQAKLFVSMGTVNAQRAAPLYAKIIEALADLDLQVIAAAPVEYFKTAPKHWIIQERVPQLQLLAHVDAVFCHGGHNTTMEALAYGRPLLIAPIRDDQPVIAEQVKAFGAGLRTHFTRSKPRIIQQKIKKILDCSQIKSSAIRASKSLVHSDLIYQQTEYSETSVQLPTELGAHRASQIIQGYLDQMST